MWWVEALTWNHTVAALVKAAPDLHHVSLRNSRARDLRIHTNAEFPVLRNHVVVQMRSSRLRRTPQLCKCGVPTEADAGHLGRLFTYLREPSLSGPSWRLTTQ